MSSLNKASALSASAQSAWPSKPIRFVVPFVPGGTSDIVARTVAQELSRQLPFPVVLDNKAGGGGVPAMQEVARAAGDGHTVILGHVGSLAVNPYIFANTGYDVNQDFAPVTLLAKVPSLFVVHPDVPAKNLGELVAHVKRHPGQLNYASAGNASAASGNYSITIDTTAPVAPAIVSVTDEDPVRGDSLAPSVLVAELVDEPPTDGGEPVKARRFRGEGRRIGRTLLWLKIHAVNDVAAIGRQGHAIDGLDGL